MERILASKVELKPTGQVAISTTASGSHFEYVYRAGRDVAWDRAEGCFLTPYSGGAGKASCSDWIARIAEVLTAELGMRLVITQQTEWMGVPAEVRAQMQAIYKP